jgi:hypothetical protein
MEDDLLKKPTAPAGQPEATDGKETKPQNIVIQVEPARFNITCYGFHLWAEDFLAAAKVYAPTARKGSYVPQFLCCQSIELSLKGFLSLKGATRTELKKKFGHNLLRLHDEAVAKGLGDLVAVQSGDRDVVATANQAYDSKGGKKLQYFDIFDAMTAFKHLPELSPLEEMADRLQAPSLRKALLEA